MMVSARERLPPGAGVTAIVAFNDRTALGLLEAPTRIWRSLQP
ncbi:hypothetical protein [Nonomuraea turcica]|nr:hypothetical protein [Nonomuraea sp. G32]MDP4503258.1 hypothetical protein [Nonomuraea sp. G32]